MLNVLDQYEQIYFQAHLIIPWLREKRVGIPHEKEKMIEEEEAILIQIVRVLEDEEALCKFERESCCCESKGDVAVIR